MTIIPPYGVTAALQLKVSMAIRKYEIWSGHSSADRAHLRVFRGQSRGMIQNAAFFAVRPFIRLAELPTYPARKFPPRAMRMAHRPELRSRFFHRATRSYRLLHGIYRLVALEQHLRVSGALAFSLLP